MHQSHCKLTGNFPSAAILYANISAPLVGPQRRGVALGYRYSLFKEHNLTRYYPCIVYPCQAFTQCVLPYDIQVGSHLLVCPRRADGVEQVDRVVQL
jgi:hypothetical protein